LFGKQEPYRDNNPEKKPFLPAEKRVDISDQAIGMTRKRMVQRYSASNTKKNSDKIKTAPVEYRRRFSQTA
jgi:hypothetical protein